jgi:glycosyltransferase involved in cell wall biosynthesis
VTQPPQVSIITCFLNAERFLSEAVESVLGQTIGDWELLLIDDGSTDGSTEIAQRYAHDFSDRVRYFEHASHKIRGLAASRNLGLARARGQLLTVLDSDDVWLPQKLERQLAILNAHPEAAMIYGRPLYWHSWSQSNRDIDDWTPETLAEPDHVYCPPELITKTLKGTGYNACPSDLLLRRDTLIALGGFEEGFLGGYSMFEDSALLVKFYLFANVFISNETWIRYRLHEKSICALETRAGRHHANRAFYLSWLLEYLKDQGISDAFLIWRIRGMRFSSQHPWISDLLRPARNVVHRLGVANACERSETTKSVEI